MSDRPTILLEHHLKELRLPTFLREYDRMASECAEEGVGHPDYLLRLSELELIDRHHRAVSAQDQGSALPGAQEPRHLRLQCDPVDQQAAGDPTRQVRVHRPQGEHNRHR